VSKLEPGTEVRVFGPGHPDDGWPGEVRGVLNAAIVWIAWDDTIAGFWRQTGRRNDAFGAHWFAPMDHPAVRGRDHDPQEG
jgi:hypothetical protein